MKNSTKKISGGKEDKTPVSSRQELQKKRAMLELEIAMGKSRDTAELASIRQEIARRLTEINRKQETDIRPEVLSPRENRKQ